MGKIDWMERLRAEKDDLTKKTDKLENFLDSKDFDKLGYVCRCLLRNQYASMEAYLDILHKRIRLENVSHATVA